MNKKKYYDYIFIGTSIINMLEAIYQKQIDQNSKILLINAPKPNIENGNICRVFL